MAAKSGESVRLTELPACDICLSNGDALVPARYDGKTTSGPWAFMCGTHFALHGVGLGTGRGQRLLVGEEDEDDA